MPQLRVTSLSVYRAYAQHLASQHKAIKDFVWGSEDVVQSRSRSDLATSFLWALPYPDVQYNHAHSDNISKRKLMRMSYMEKRDSERFADIEVQMDRCEYIAETIIARILRDKRGYQATDGQWYMLATVVETWKLTPIEYMAGSTMYIGYEIEAQVLENTNLDYKADAWRDGNSTAPPLAGTFDYTFDETFD